MKKKNWITNTDTLLNKCQEVWGNEYGFKEVVFINSKTPIKIWCNICQEFFYKKFGEFIYQKIGHRKCRINIQKKTQEQFINEVNIKHNFKFDYKNTVYNGWDSIIDIICPTHGLFQQSAGSHLHGTGCNNCAINLRTKSQGQFINQANDKFNFKFNYDKVNYINHDTNIIINCPIHGDFSQLPKVHLNSKFGCPECAFNNKKMNTEEFIKLSNKLHNNLYLYENTIYKKMRGKVLISCPKHGDFSQRAAHHLHGAGCPICSRAGKSHKEKKWLDILNIPIRNRNIQFKINNKYFKVDGLDKNNKIIYEFYGNFWHGNPKLYNQNEINKITKKSFGELYQRTLEREKELKDAGYTLITIWEDEFDLIYA